MASHFGPHGEVTNWQSKEQFFMIIVVVVGVSFVAGFGRKKRPRLRRAYFITYETSELRFFL
jgi:hypothetical protein